MPLALDASSASSTFNQGAGTGFGPSGTGVTTSSISVPANALIEFSIGFNQPGTATLSSVAISNTGTALTWNQEALRQTTSGGAVARWQAWNASAQAITITVTATSSVAWVGASPSSSWRCDVWTGADADQSTAATPVSGTSTSQTNNFAITTTRDNSVISVFGEDWGQTGVPTSSDTMEATWNIAGQTSGGRARKAIGAAGAQTINFVTGGAGPQLNYVLTEILAAPERRAGLLLLGVG